MCVGSSMCTMNLSDAGIEAFRLTMNCAIGTSHEMNNPLIALTIFYEPWATENYQRKKTTPPKLGWDGSAIQFSRGVGEGSATGCLPFFTGVWRLPLFFGGV
uniref:Uncharacterized protein n=1 Tax=Arundo donax TaxID=35708 RepID=A0A0A9FGQ2_ARUDO